MTVPISLIIDDGGPVNMMYWHQPAGKHVLLVPNAVARDFAGICRVHGAKGKFSVVPMPGGLGRIDKGLNRVPDRHLQGFLKIAREGIAPRFDITCELLTHLTAVDLATGFGLHLYEDEWVRRAGVDEITDYIALAMRILKNVGLPSNGVASPWATGIDNEKRYAEAIARAQWRVHRRKFAWYFLHCRGDSPSRRPWLVWQDRSIGLKSVTVPANTNDVFWMTQRSTSQRTARVAADAGINRLITKNGRDGQIRQLFDENNPITILTHWQSLFSNGRCAGLAGLERLLKRVERIFGGDVQWMRCSELARQAVDRRRD
ncbi:MAG: hypothetical protein KAV00_01490 [Phycisphaerae bacterium]|nr:hypothetical protein [Phycisphaerae bacterium]